MGGISVGALFATLALDKSKFDSGVKGSKGLFSSLGDVAKRSAKIVAAAFLAIAAAAAVVAAKSVSNAVEQERAWGRLDAVFGKNAQGVRKWAESNAFQFGVADDVLEVSVANYAQWAKNVGLSTSEAELTAQQMAKRSSEIALATGKSYDEVFDALMRGSQGATRGLKEYGVAVDTSAIQDEAYRLGLAKKGEAIDATAAAQARQSIILQQTEPFQRQAIEMDESAAKGKLQLGVITDNVMDAIGAAVLFVVTNVMPPLLAAFSGVADWVTANGPRIQAILDKVFEVVGGAIDWVVANVIPPLVDIFTTLTEETAPDLGKAIRDIADRVMPAVERAGDLAKLMFDELGKAIDWINDNILPPVTDALDNLADFVLPGLTDALTWARENWDIVFPALAAMILTVVVPAFVAWAIAAGAAAVATIIALLPILLPILAIGLAVGLLAATFKTFGLDVGRDMAHLGEWIEDVFSGIGRFMGDVWRNVSGAFRTGINWIIGLMNQLIGFLNSIQIHIPGFETPLGVVARFDWGGLNLAKIPLLMAPSSGAGGGRRLASGTTDWMGGFARMNEQGPEIAWLPRHTGVSTAGDTRDIAAAARMILEGAAGGRGGPLIGSQTIYGVMPGDVERETDRALRRATLSWSLEAGR